MALRCVAGHRPGTRTAVLQDRSGSWIQSRLEKNTILVYRLVLHGLTVHICTRDLDKGNGGNGTLKMGPKAGIASSR